MAKKSTKNQRCPFKDECEKKCEYVNRELECSYYKNNACGDNVIPDQEKLRDLKESIVNSKREEEELANIVLDEEENEGDTAKESSLICSDILGELTTSSEIKMIPLMFILQSDSNIFTVEEDITDLAEDIKTNGLLTPLTVCPSDMENFYRLISGHRRYKALSSLHENKAFEVPCLVTSPKTPEAEEYMLIRANTSSRVLSYTELEESRKRAEALLLKLREQGVEFPGKLRTHVAKLLKVSEAQLAKVKYVSEHLIEDFKNVGDDRITFDDRYKISHWSEDLQKGFYDKRIKGRTGREWQVSNFDARIKSGGNPFEDTASSGESAEVTKKKCYYFPNLPECSNIDKFKELKDVPLCADGLHFKCQLYCCRCCNDKYNCKHVCASVKNLIEEELRDDETSDNIALRVRRALQRLMLEKGYDSDKLEDIANLADFELQDSTDYVFRSSCDNEIDVIDLLYYLSVLKITPDEFFRYVKTEIVFPEREDIKPSWDIYLGEDKE